MGKRRLTHRQRNEKKERRLRGHFEREDFICPWARSGEKTDYLFLPQQDQLKRAASKKIAGRLCEFMDGVRQQLAMVVVLPRSPEDTTEARQAVLEGLAVVEAAAYCNRLEMPVLLLDFLQEVREWLFARMMSNPNYQHIIHRVDGRPDDRDAFVISMGPHYEPEHPRWAPESVLVATLVGAVKKAQKHAAYMKEVDQQMIRRTGVLYNPQVLFLPEQPDHVVDFGPLGRVNLSQVLRDGSA